MAGVALFPFSSRSEGVPLSQKKDKKRVIFLEIGVLKRQLQYNFTRSSQRCEDNSKKQMGMCIKSKDNIDLEIF